MLCDWIVNFTIPLSQTRLSTAILFDGGILSTIRRFYLKKKYNDDNTIALCFSSIDLQ